MNINKILKSIIIIILLFLFIQISKTACAKKESSHMIEPTTISESLLYSTIRIEADMPGNKKSTGSSFIYSIKYNGDKIIPVIITNKHVIAGATKGIFQLHEGAETGGKTLPNGENIVVTMDGFEKYWICHPDKEIDLCAMPFQPIRVQAEKNGKHIFISPLDESMIWDNSKLGELSAVEEVLMIGYPIGLWDTVNNYPIFRRGITAIHSSVDFQGKPIGVVDIAAFPGSSGSPVMIVNEGRYSTKKALLVAGNRVILLGVLFGGPMYTVDGHVVIKDIPTATLPVSQSSIPVNIGYYIKAKEILVLGNHVIKVLKENGALK